MKLPKIRLGAKKEDKEPACYHSFEKCKGLFEDPGDPKRRTGILCTVCGQKIS